MRSSLFLRAFVVSLFALLAKAKTLPDLYEATIAELQDGLAGGDFTSVDLVKVSIYMFNNFCHSHIEHICQAYFARIDEVNLKGPALRAVLETNPSALSQAAALDKERQEFGPRGLLHGIPILVKDNIATIASEGSICRHHVGVCA